MSDCLDLLFFKEMMFLKKLLQEKWSRDVVVVVESFGWSYLVRCRGNKNFLNFLNEIIIRLTRAGGLTKCSSHAFSNWTLHVRALRLCSLWEPQFGKNWKLLQSCRLFASLWGGASWGGTGRCLEQTLMEPSTTAGPRTGEAFWALVCWKTSPCSIYQKSLQFFLCCTLKAEREFKVKMNKCLSFNVDSVFMQIFNICCNIQDVFLWPFDFCLHEEDRGTSFFHIFL